MTVKEAAVSMGVSIGMVYKLIHAGDIQYIQIGRRILPLDESIAAYKTRQTRQAEPKVTVPKKESFKVLFQK